MYQIIKNEPIFFTNAKKKVKSSHFVSSAWHELGEDEKGFKTKLREYILLEEQNMLCAYCEQEIESDETSSNTDHFKKRDWCARETLEYNNLLVSCKNEFHCENIKDKFKFTRCSEFDKMVNPVIENPNNFFDYGIDGDIFAKDGLSVIDKEKAEFTIKVFELNNISLQKDRAKIGESLNFYHDHGSKMDDVLQDIINYPSFIKNIYKKLKQKEVTP
jgi:uncharacterized protein (TIGR02646 family)